MIAIRHLPPLPRRLLDALLVAAILAVGTWWGARFERAWHAAGQTSQYYQNYFEPAVMTACERGFALSQTRPPQLDDFLQQRSDSFDCASLPADLAMSTEGVYQFSWYYLVLTVGTAWRVLGVSWSGLAPLFGLLFGTVLVLAFGLFRLGMGRPLALICTVALGVSTSHLVNLPHLRDYAKAPFVLALILLMAWMVRGLPTRRRLLVLACASGGVLGVGYGFRTDLLANIPPLLLTIFFFVPGGVFKNLALKTQAAAACLLVFLIVAWPAVAFVAARGGCQWHVALLGFSSPFGEPLGITPASYDWGPYSDNFVWGAVGSRFMPHADSAVGPSFCGPEYDRMTGVYLGRILTTFPGDVATRALASLVAVTDFPTNARLAPLPSYDGPFYQWRGDLLHSLDGYGPLLLLPFLCLVAAIDLRFGLWLAGLILWFGALPMLQFNIRHYFHLEWMGWFVMGTLASLSGRRMGNAISVRWRRRTTKHPVPVPEPPPGKVSTVTATYPRVLVMVACFALIAAGVAGARRWQRSTVTSLTASMVEWTSEPVALDRADEGDLMVLRPRLPGSAAARGRFWVEFLRIDVDPRACGAGGTVAVRYDSPREQSTRFWTIHGDQAAILTPVFVSFSDIAVPSGNAGCIRGVYRAPILKPFPVWLFVDVPADLQRLRAVQSYAGPERILDLAGLLRFAWNSPRAFGSRVADLALDFAPPWGHPTVYARPDHRVVTRPEMRRVRALVDDSHVGFRSQSTHAVDRRWEIQGQSEGPFAYLLAARRDAAPDSRLLVTGVLKSGGLSVGLINNGRWIDQTVSVRRMGEFAVVIEPPVDGPYDIIIANNEPDTAKQTHATISTIAWIDPSSGAPERKVP